MSLSVSIVVVAYDIVRELPRTLRSLSPDAQKGLVAEDYEVIVIDNGSPTTVPEDLLASFPGRLRYERLEVGDPSPAHAANVGVAQAEAPLVGLIVDGARMASPGLLAHAILANRLPVQPVVASLGWHLGPTRHMEAAEAGYDQSVEDRLLDESGWEDDGYCLFTISTLAGSSARGWFGAMGESSALFLRRDTWHELGGLDESFTLPGGGLVNHDLYSRACSLDDVQLIVLLGEGTFHQYHGGAATSRRLSWDEMHEDYQDIRGHPYVPPRNQAVYLGHVPASTFGHLATSVDLALTRASKRSGAVDLSAPGR